MRGLASLPASASHRTRRWDALVLGSALPGLVAGVVLAMRGARVLLLEEDTGGARFPGLREPFLTTGADRGSVLGSCLRALGIPPIDRQRIAPSERAYQVVFPDARVDVGTPRLTAEELAAWGFAKPEAARALVAALAEAAAAERDALLSSPIARGGRRRPRAPEAAAPASPGRARGLPREVTAAGPRLAALLEAQVRALSNLGAAAPSPEARARLLGLALEGGTAVTPGDVPLHTLLRRRFEALHGECRSLAPGFRLVSVGGLCGLEPSDCDEIWAGRALVLNAPAAGLAAALAPAPLPEALAADPPTGRRIALHLRLARERLPVGMSARVICVGDPARPLRGTNLVALRRFAPATGGDVHLVASAVVAPDAEIAGAEAEIAACVERLIPFCEGPLARLPAKPPVWDGEALRLDPPRGGGWPAEWELRASSRPPLYALHRGAVGGLGCEGDLLLGWRGGERIADDLA